MKKTNTRRMAIEHTAAALWPYTAPDNTLPAAVAGADRAHKKVPRHEEFGLSARHFYAITNTETRNLHPFYANTSRSHH